MPEFGEIKYSCDILRDNILHLYITNVEYTGREGKNTSYINRDLLQSELPLRIDSIIDRSKRIIFVMNNRYEQDSAFCFFYAMNGYIRFQEAKHDQMIITLSRKRKDGSFKEKKTIYYGDSRMLGFIRFATTGEEIVDIFKNLGPDIGNGEVSLDYFSKIIRNKRMKNKQIAALLLETKHFTAIGNWMRTEILYIAKISPYRELQELSDKDIKCLYKCIILICELSYKMHGLTLHDFRCPEGKDGNYKALIYGRKEDDDENKVIREKFGVKPKGKTDTRRSIWWVKNIQK